MEVDFVDNSDNVGDSTVQVVEVSVHQGPVGVTSAILVSEQAPTMNTVVPAPQCVNLLAFAASGPHSQCATPCPEYMYNRANACSGHCFTTWN